MNKMSLSVLVLCGFCATVSAQQGESCGTKAGILLAKDKPTIYITFERPGKVKPTPTRLAATDTSRRQSDDPNIQVVWLRLHNNTRWAINFPTDSLYVGPKITAIRLCDGRGALGLRTDIEVNARYEADAVSGDESARTSDAAQPPVIRRSDVFSTSWLPPGGSVIFSVPREHLAEGLAIYIPYNYEWEYGERIFRSDEPQHRVYFRASDLPERVQTTSK